MNSIRNNSPAFGGAYVINYNVVSKKLRQPLEEVFPKGRMIFDDYMGKDNHVLYVLQDKHDYPVAKFIERNRIRFKFMPEINTKKGFETRTQFEDYIEENSPRVIKNRKTLLEYTKEQFDLHTANCPIRPRREILKSLGYKPQDLRCEKDSQGSRIYRDVNGNVRIKMSPRNHEGHFFLFVKEDVYSYELLRFEYNEKGELVKKYSNPDDMKQFKQKYKDAIRFLCQPESFQ